MTAVKQFLTFSGGAPFQPAIARALAEGDADIAELRDSLAIRRDLPHSAGVACVPLSAFCHEDSPTAEALGNWVRFTFVKDETTLRTALDRLAAWVATR